MRLLKILPIFILMSAISCKAGGPLTPKEAFDETSKLYSSNDTEGFYNILSLSAKLKIQKGAEKFNALSGKTKDIIADENKIPRERLESMGPKEYLALQMELFKKKNDDLLLKSLTSEIINIEKNGDKANFIMSNGVTLTFIKETPYWRFESEDFF